MIGTTIYEIPTKHTGLTSKLLCNKDGFRIQIPVKEHFHSRQQAGLYIVEEFTKKGYKYIESKLDSDLDKFRHVHYVTQRENIELSGIQNSHLTRNLTWQEQYSLAGIELIRDRGTVPKNYYSHYSTPDGDFANFGEVIEKYPDIEEKTLKYRFASASRKWESWQRTEP